MTRRRGLLLVGIVLGGLAGIPIGAYLGHRAAPEPASPGGMRSVRSHYSPAIYTDPRFVEQLRPTVEALERGCRASGDHCREARAVRERLTELQMRH